MKKIIKFCLEILKKTFFFITGIDIKIFEIKSDENVNLTNNYWLYIIFDGLYRFPVLKNIQLATKIIKI